MSKDAPKKQPPASKPPPSKPDESRDDELKHPQNNDDRLETGPSGVHQPEDKVIDRNMRKGNHGKY